MFIKCCVTSLGDAAAVHGFGCKKSADLNSSKLLLNLSERFLSFFLSLQKYLLSEKPGGVMLEEKVKRLKE